MSVITHVGQKVIAVDAFGHLKPAIIRPVPPEWRNANGDALTTTKGQFPKAWLHMQQSGQIVPWPLEDVFTDAAAAAIRAAALRPPPSDGSPSDG